MPNIKDAFPSKHLSAADLGGNEPVVAIERISFEPVGRTKEMKAVVYFTGKAKGLVLNKTNAKKITSIAGSEETEDWAGVKIQLYATETEFEGQTVDCIRVKPVQNQKVSKPAPVAPSAEVTDDDIPF